MHKIEYSVVVAVYNEQDCLIELYRRLNMVLSKVTADYEIIFVNDASTDSSGSIIRNLSLSDPKVKFIDFARNFGHQIAITAGIDYAGGRAV
ncbi:MAG: glycosyltransferase, partial [Candidatus Omnitrophota bacterium]